MAITTYAELQTAVLAWIPRTTLTSEVVDWITLAEDYFNDHLRTRQMEQRATAPINSEYADLPTDFLELRNIKLNDDPNKAINYVSPQTLVSNFSYSTNLTTGADPLHFTIEGDCLRFSPTPSSDTVEITYVKKIPALTDSNTTNWLLTARPSLYLYGAAIHGCSFIRDAQRMAEAERIFVPMFEKFQEQNKASAYANTPLQIRADIQRP